MSIDIIAGAHHNECGPEGANLISSRPRPTAWFLARVVPGLCGGFPVRALSWIPVVSLAPKLPKEFHHPYESRLSRQTASGLSSRVGCQSVDKIRIPPSADFDYFPSYCCQMHRVLPPTQPLFLGLLSTGHLSHLTPPRFLNYLPGPLGYRTLVEHSPLDF
jgi:hypothetical protein